MLFSTCQVSFMSAILNQARVVERLHIRSPFILCMVLYTILFLIKPSARFSEIGHIKNTPSIQLYKSFKDGSKEETQ